MQTELHRHLDVCTRTETLYRLGQARNLIPQSTSLESFRRELILDKPLADLNTVLDRFTLFQKVLDRPEIIEQVAYEGVEDCWKEGTHNVELRYSPSFVSEYSQISWEEALAAFERGLAKALQKHPKMRAGLICIASRNYGVEKTDETVEFFLKNSHRFIGLDLAGNERDFPARLFEPSFKKAIKAGANITIHAGEDSGPESIWEAIELLGAKRIGHGISSIRDPKLIDFLAKRRICLEMCPTSNWLTSAVKSFESHPLPQVLRAGVPVSINTDDPGVFGVTLPQEIQICHEKMGLSWAELEKCQFHAAEASFLRNKSA